MALPVYQSMQSTVGSGTSVVVTKPTSLAVGDLMIGLGALDDNSLGIPSLPSGWTASLARTSADESTFKMVAGFRIADAGDVAASDFTFTATNSPEVYSCHILRLTTTSSFSSPVLGTAGDDDSTSTTTPSFVISFDAKVIDALLIAFYARTGATTSVSTYALSATNPTWTERYDTSAAGLSVAIATAPTTGTTSFTTFGVTTVASDSGNSVILLSVAAVSNASADVGHLDAAPTVFGIPGSNTTNASVGHLAAAPTLNGLAAKDSSDATQWSNVDKPSTTWSNQNK